MRLKMLSIVFLTFLLSACSSPATEPPVISPSPDVSVLSTQAVATVYAAAQTASAPTATIATPILPTATPTFAKPVMHFDADTNCRSGPGIKFSLVGVIKAGQTAEPLGLPAQSNYWVVKSPTGNGDCWVVADYITPSGNMTMIPKVTAPPTYTPRPVPVAPALASWDFSCAYAFANSQSASTVTVILKWQDSSEFEIGYGVYRNGELIASLSENATTYTDIAFLSYGETVSYYVEAYNYDGAARSKVVKAFCQ
jgi:uncharacterized protein YraI